MRRAFVVGVGMTKFERPGRSGRDYPELAQEAAAAALGDAGIDFTAVEHVCASYVYADSTAGQRALYGLGMTGVPFQNLNNNCASASSALYYARQLIAGGLHDCVLAAGFEKMAPGSLPDSAYPGKADPLQPFVAASQAVYGPTDAPRLLSLFGNAGREHRERYGTTNEQFAKVAEKNHRHSVNNPNAQFQDEYTLDEILAGTVLCDPLTKLQCSPTSNGAAAAIVASEDFVDRHGLAGQAVEIVGQAMISDRQGVLESESPIAHVGAGISAEAARVAYTQAGLGPDDVDVIELHDCFSVNELLTYEALGLCEPGGSGALIDAGDTTYGGRWVVNPSGGLISKGHPLGATGLAQCAELSWQLRGEAGKRQVEGARVALAHNIGLGSAGVVTIYRPAER